MGERRAGDALNLPLTKDLRVNLDPFTHIDHLIKTLLINCDEVIHQGWGHRGGGVNPHQMASEIPSVYTHLRPRGYRIRQYPNRVHDRDYIEFEQIPSTPHTPTQPRPGRRQFWTSRIS